VRENRGGEKLGLNLAFAQIDQQPAMFQ